MTNAILRGKPDAGNPHVRFDEGEVASEKPRRGSLLYRRIGLSAVICLAVLSASADGAEIVRTGAGMTVAWNTADGTLASLVLDGDPYRMNWIEGIDRWGAIRIFSMANDGQETVRMPFVELREEGDRVVSVYQRGAIRAEVRRTVSEKGLSETYVFRNVETYPVYFLRDHLGILATFNDGLPNAAVAETQRCHAHIWCGGENAWVRALKMGPFPTELALVLQQGDIDAYSVRRIRAAGSSDRGDFVLHPAPFHLNPGETKTIAWTLAPYPAGRFDEALLKMGGVKIDFKNETIFPDETFEIDVTGPDGRTRHYSRKPEKGVGVYTFAFEAGGKKAKAEGYCSPAFADLMRARIDFLCDRQQCLDPKSPLYGAFLLWDAEDNAPYFDYVWRDHNATRERTIMGCTVARWLRKNDDPKVRRSLDLFEQFVRREYFDTETGVVYDTIGKNPKYKRLYNAPQVVMFLKELYALKKDPVYLDWIARAILGFYRAGGSNFYPNGCDFSSEIALLESTGRQVPELRAAVDRHIANVVRNGILYPEHEARFEQTIAAPAVTLLAQYARYIRRTPEVMSALAASYDILGRFQGNQPSHKWHETAIRHWDGYWFGKWHLYTDTLHQHSTISARAFLQYAAVTGDASQLPRAERCLRNCLYMFRPDGFGTAAYIQPLTITLLNKDGSLQSPTRRGECHDPLVNDQDYALFLAMGSGFFGDYGGMNVIGDEK